MSDSTPPDHQPALLSEDAAARECGVSRPTFRRWAVARCITPVLVPGTERRELYRQEDVDVFRRSRRAS